MGYTKRQLISDALDAIGIDDDVFDIPASKTQKAMKKLNAMMAEWNGMGLRLGYPIPTNAEGGDLDDDAGIPDSAWEAVITNLALRVAPSFGKQVMPETKVTAKGALDMLLGKVMPPQMQLGRIPAGAGNKPWRYDDPFLQRQKDPLDAGPDSEMEFN